MIEDSVLDLVAALHIDQGLTCSDNFETYDLGKYIYGIKVDNSLNGTVKVDSHVQWRGCTTGLYKHSKRARL